MSLCVFGVVGMALHCLKYSQGVYVQVQEGQHLGFIVVLYGFQGFGAVSGTPCGYTPKISYTPIVSVCQE